MKKVIILTPYMSGSGGTETVMTHFFAGYNQVPKKYSLKLISIGGTSHTEWLDGINAQLLRLPFATNKRILRLEYLILLPFIELFLLHKEKPDVVISTNPVMWTLAFIYKKWFKLNFKVVGWYHYSLLSKPLSKRQVAAADYFWAISSGIKEQLIQNGVAKDRVFLVFNPIEPVDYVVERTIGRPKHLIYIGRLMLDGQKNMRELFNALSEVDGDWILDIFGDSAEIADIKNYADAKKISHKIVWHGFNKNPWQTVKSADALIMTSKYEGLPMVLIEAAARGVFMISSNVDTGPVDIIEDGVTGELYDLGDQKALSTKLQAIVNGKPLPNQADIQASISAMYVSEYFANITRSLDVIMNRNE